MLTQDHVQKKQKETRMHKNAAQAHNGVRATASMPFSAAVSCCFKNILAPGIPVYKANGLVKMPLVKKNMKGGQPLNCDVETAGKQLSQRRQSLKDLLHDALKVCLAASKAHTGQATEVSSRKNKV